MNTSEEGISGCFHLFPRKAISSIHLFQLVIQSQKETMSGWARELERTKSLKTLFCSKNFSASGSENYKIILLLLKCVISISNRDGMNFRVHS